MTMRTKAEILRERLRTFHLTGRGLEEWTPERPLWPAAFREIGLEGEAPPGAWLEPLVKAAAPRRTLARDRLAARYAGLAERLRALLEEDPAANSPETFGEEARQFFDAQALRELKRPSRPKSAPDPHRRRRMEDAARELEQWKDRAAAWPVMMLFATDPPAPTAGVTITSTQDPFRDARSASVELLTRFGSARRASEVARLEADGHFDDAIHAERILREDWQSAEAVELEALPLVVVRESALRLAGESLAGFAQTLRSGLPVLVIVESRVEDLAPDLPGAAMAHPEAFVAGVTPARMDDCRTALESAASALRPAAVFFSTSPALREAELMVRTGLAPRFRRSPGGLTATEEGWAAPAGLVALEAFRGHMRVLPEDAPGQDLMEAAEYLARFAVEPPLAIPFVEAVDGDGGVRRVALSREAMFWCRERERARIVAPPRIFHPGPPANPDAPAPDQIEQARKEGASQAVHRLVSALLGSSPLKIGDLSAAMVQPTAKPAPPPAIAAAAPVAVAESAPPDAGSEDPYVESYLCTSCNDCLKVNDRMFQYDGNQQIYLADASAGTYAELVQAAEKCPAKCIHPGTPRPGDGTATAAMKARAAKLNAG
ncbi:MAG: hypothetical protein K2X35_24985 [Bryobacteraceae bacterium]|nr:hypothetical protein [Bryobacteraceae bacterium]